MGSLISLLMMSPTIQFASLTMFTLAYILITPYTKVEESFSIQAIHDFIYLGIPRAIDLLTKLKSSQITIEVNPKFPLDLTPSVELVNNIHEFNYSDWHWDHQEFPGAVPRTFIGPFIVSLLSFPVSLWEGLNDKMIVQLATRVNLAFLVLCGFCYYSACVARKFGAYTQSALIVLTLTQFHFLYYASRPLPNTFALILVLFASGKWLTRQYSSFIVLVAITVVIFRFETALLFGPMIIYSIWFAKELSLVKLFLIGIPAGLASLGTTILFDSFMWQKWIWPEGYGLYFNVFLNKSSEWGTSPFLWYFYSALPRSLLCSIFFVPFATKRCIKTCLGVSLAFITLYSFLGHKELRFIIYCIPLLNTCAANAIVITGNRFFSTKPYPESWLGNFILREIGFKAATEEEIEAAEREAEEKERETELKEAERNRRKKSKSKDKLPAKYDAIKLTSSSIRRRKSNKTGVEEVLDEQYSKITAAILVKNKEPPGLDLFRTPLKDDFFPETAYLSTFIIVMMALHVWFNIGCLVYASVASWHNYPGGDAVTWTNERIQTVDLKHHNLQDIGVYVCNFAAQTGFSRFLQINGMVYDKSPDYSLMTIKHQRISKWRSHLNSRWDSNADHDFAAIYFILEGIDVNFLTKHCSTTRPKKASSSSSSSPSKKSSPHSSSHSRLPDTLENVVCKLGPDAQDCSLVKVVNGFDGIDFGRAPRSIVIRTVPKLWILRCAT